YRFLLVPRNERSAPLPGSGASATGSLVRAPDTVAGADQVPAVRADHQICVPPCWTYATRSSGPEASEVTAGRGGAAKLGLDAMSSNPCQAPPVNGITPRWLRGPVQLPLTNRSAASAPRGAIWAAEGPQGCVAMPEACTA